MSTFTHLDPQGEARMVDVSDKQPTERIAVAEGFIETLPETVAAIQAGSTAKGAVLGVARIAGIMAAKRTAELIPLCHPVPLTGVEVELEVDPALPGVRVRATARTVGVTGVEMEALTAASCAMLTVYDMCKARDRAMRIGGIRLLSKSGGRSGTWTREGND